MNKDQIILTAYAEAFGQCYPSQNVSFQKGKGGYYVVLNGDKGDKALTLDELKEATQAFKR